MASSYGGHFIQSDNPKLAADPLVQGLCRCVLLVDACVRFVEEVGPAIQKGGGAFEFAQAAATLGTDVSNIGEYDARQMRLDLNNLARFLGVELHPTQRDESEQVN